MKSGRSLVDLATEIERRKTAKKDFIADTRELEINAAADKIAVGDGLVYDLTDTAHRQISDQVGVPARYYQRMRTDAPDLLAINVNKWFAQDHERRMLRTLDGKATAYLSDRYQRIDHDHIAEVVLPVLIETPGIQIVSCELTERRLYIKAVNTLVRSEVKIGDVVEAGVLVTNSESGHGAVSITPLVHRLICLNGMVVPDQKYRRNHVGRRADTGDSIYEILSDETRKADDRAVLLKVRDVVRASLDRVQFDQVVGKMKAASEGERIEDAVRSIEVLAASAGLVESERISVLRHLIEGSDLSRYGLLNAVTRAAQDVESYDRSTELEQIGGRLLDLNQKEWRELAVAA